MTYFFYTADTDSKNDINDKMRKVEDYLSCSMRVFWGSGVGVVRIDVPTQPNIPNPVRNAYGIVDQTVTSLMNTSDARLTACGFTYSGFIKNIYSGSI